MDSNASLKKSNLALTNKQKQQYGDLSEYFELYFENNEKEKINLVDSKMKMTIKLDSSKEFLGIFVVDKNNVVKKLNYKVISSNVIEVEGENLEKYIISYQTKIKEDKDISNMKIEDKDKANKNLKWILASFFVLIIGLIVIALKKVSFHQKNLKESSY